MNDKAIEAAIYAFAQSRKDALGGLPKLPSTDEVVVCIPHMRAAIIAYLRNVEVTQAMHLAAMNRKSDTLYKSIFEAMCAAKADEMENGV